MQISEISRKQVTTLTATEPVARALFLMEEHGIRHLPVIRNRVPVGMLSDHNVLNLIGWQLEPRKRAAALSQRVEKVMRQPIITVEPTMPIDDVARRMLGRNIGAMPLVADGHLKGIVTKSDMLKCYALGTAVVAEEILEAQVSKHMHTEVLCTSPSDATLDALRTMQSNQIQHLPVVENDRLVGMLSDRDIMRGKPPGQVANRGFGRQATVTSPLHVRGIMESEVVTIPPEATLCDVAATLVDRRIGAVPVTQGQTLLGIISETDLIRVMSEQNSLN